MNRFSSRRLIHLLLILMMAGYALFFSAQLIRHYYSFGSRALDLGNMTQAIWNTAHGRPFHQTNQPGATNRLSLHVEPILLPIALLYRLYSSPETLFILQAVLVALGAIPVFALARRKLHSRGLALLFAFIYLLLPPLQGATLLDFHAVTLAPTFLLAAFYYLETERPGRFALFAGLAAACKEDIILIVLMLGLYALLFKRQYRLGLITIGLTLGWAYLAVFVIPPALAGTENIHWGRYGHLGASPLDIVLNLVLEPQRAFTHLQAVNALGYLNRLLQPTAYLALLSPLTLLLALPSLGINLLSSYPPMQRVNSLMYVAPLVPALMIGSIYGAATLRRLLMAMIKRPGRRLKKDQRPLPLSPQTVTTLLLGGLLLAATLSYHAAYGYLPGGGQYRGWEEITPHHRRGERIFAQIPPEAALSAQDRLNPHVSHRQTLYIFDRIEDADHILLDVTQDSWPLHPVDLRHRVDQFLAGGFGVVDAFDGYLLLAKDRPSLPTTLPDPFFDFARVARPEQFTPQFPARVLFDDRLELLGYSLGLGAHEKFLPVVTLYWRAREPLEQNYRLWPFFIDRQGQVIEDPSQRPLVAPLWYPPRRWAPGEIIQTATLPLTLAPRPGDRFTLAVGVTADQWPDPAQRLPITAADPDLYRFENETWVRLGAFERVDRKTFRPVRPASPPAAPSPPLVEFWDAIALTRVELPQRPLRPGEPLPFTLQWQSSAPLPLDLTTFAHLLDAEGRVVAQLDWQPQDEIGYLPTTAWQPGRPVRDSQTLALSSSLPPGQYRLVVGWYYALTGDRLPLTAGADGDAAPVGSVVVE